MALIPAQPTVVEDRTQRAQQAHVVEHWRQVLPSRWVCDTVQKAHQYVVEKCRVGCIALQEPCIQLHDLGVGKVVQSLVEIKRNLHRHPGTLLGVDMCVNASKL